jgi:hypothetical protein
VNENNEQTQKRTEAKPTDVPVKDREALQGTNENSATRSSSSTSAKTPKPKSLVRGS